MDIKRILAILCLCIGIAIPCIGQTKIEKAECDTANYNLTMVLSCPQTKDILYRATKEWLATHIKNFQQKLQYDDKETGTIKFRNSSYIHATKSFPQRPTIDMTGDIDYMVTITIKDGKYRVKTEDAMVNWSEYFYFNGTKQSNGRKSLELLGFILWSDRDKNILKSYTDDFCKICDGIEMQARELEEDDF